jgi:prolyl oligopeptidase
VIRVESVTTPEHWYRFEPQRGAWERLPILGDAPFRTSAMKSTRLVAKSADGTDVPLDVYHRADVALDGKNPTLLNVYGAYGMPFQPGFLAPRLAWLEHGGVLAFAHVRGGGEFGEEWHVAGMKEKKQRGADDFIACANELVAKGYTSPPHLGVQSKSAGAVVASMGVWQRPDLFGLAIFGSGMLQALRSEFAEGGVGNIAEFGTVLNEREFRGLLAMDALEHVRTDVVYPPMLFAVGANDPRVLPWDSGKVVARLQAVARTRGPVLLRVDFHEGHGVGSTVASETARYADYYALAMATLGRNAGKSPQ